MEKALEILQAVISDKKIEIMYCKTFIERILLQRNIDALEYSIFILKRHSKGIKPE